MQREWKKIDKAYLSKLLNDKVPAPSEEISRTIANICNKDERVLVLEGYIDKAPNEIREAFITIKFMTMLGALKTIENIVDKLTLEKIREELEKEPISEFIIQLIENKDTMSLDLLDTEVIKSDTEELKLTLNEPIAVTVGEKVGRGK